MFWWLFRPIVTGCTQLPSCTTPEKHAFRGIVCCSYSHIQIKFHGNSTKQSAEHWQNFEDTPLGLEESAFEMFDQWFCLSELGIYIESADFLITLRFVGRFANLEIYPSVFLAFLLFWGWRRQLWSPADWPYAADFAFIQRARVPRVPKPCGLCWLLEVHECQTHGWLDWWWSITSHTISSCCKEPFCYHPQEVHSQVHF